MPYMDFADANPGLFLIWACCGFGLLIVGVTAVIEKALGR